MIYVSLMIMSVFGGYVLTDYGCTQLHVVYECRDTIAMVTRRHNKMSVVFYWS